MTLSLCMRSGERVPAHADSPCPRPFFGATRHIFGAKAGCFGAVSGYSGVVAPTSRAVRVVRQGQFGTTQRPCPLLRGTCARLS
jgi:hypothetical protein